MTTKNEHITTLKELATHMATIAQQIRDAIHQALARENSEQFADMYAQTICYSLFAARCNANTHFTREYAAYSIPHFLRQLFMHIASPDLSERIAWAVDHLAEVLNRCDIPAMLQDSSKYMHPQDPLIHFYETFLAAYDTKMRTMRGVYYTPEPVVSYIVRSVDQLLKQDFDLADGLADATTLKAVSSDGKHSLETHKVSILDPAAGTGTFLYAIIEHIHATFKGNKHMWSSYVSQHLLPRLCGFELLMAPYAIAHMKLSLQLAETGYDFSSNERLRLYLTNTLEEGFAGERLSLNEWLVEEAITASNSKHDAAVIVVLGNPPYSGHSANKGQCITSLLHGKDPHTGMAIGGDYFSVAGQSLGERNSKWLNDDYIKFMRFAQWRIERTGYGILAFITNHSYLDTPTFRGMRHSLLQSFDELYILDLHGNRKKQEPPPDGTKDENIFDIQQGVAISIFVKRQPKVDTPLTATVRHADLWGPRAVYEKTQQLVGGKYHWLAGHDISTTQWTTLAPQSPLYLFVPQDSALKAEYEHNWKITEIMPVHASTIASGRNQLLIAFDADTIKANMADFVNPNIPDATLKEHYFLGVLNLPAARAAARADTAFASRFLPLCFRPFDTRHTFYAHYVTERPRAHIMRHMHQSNLSLLTHRPQSPREFTYAFCTTLLADQCVAANKSTGGGNSFQFPLYLYPQTSPEGRKPNLAPALITQLIKRLGIDFIADGKGDLYKTFGPEDIFNYIYAILHSPTYRARYAEFLKIDFPRLPLTSHADLFRALSNLGAQLVELHLMQQTCTGGRDAVEGQGTLICSGIPCGCQALSTPCGCQGWGIPGNNLIEKVSYLQPSKQSEQGRVYINKTQYFAGVPPDVWNFHIGGYQVCQKWLKDRKGRALSYNDILHYQSIVAALTETIHLMHKIDETIEEHGGWPLE